ncbi:MAG TPA: 30S ribosomal protein S2 [Chitinophagales bacterium]|nr:30S ribosomal protein S2 [Chitinophagales bacterium]
MEQITHQALLDAGVHFGHLRKKWNPKMLPFIFMEKKGIHIIDLYKTKEKLEEAAAALKSIARSGKKILFVATKKQAKGIVEECAKKVNMPYVTERWLGGMLTNFATIRKSVKKMQSIDKMLSDPGSAEAITKKERLVLTREKEKLQKVLQGIEQLNRLPAAVYVVDISHEHIALAEANKLNITSFGIVDTNSDPTKVDFPIPANDDASKSITIITQYLTEAILEGLQERKKDKDEMDAKVAETGVEEEVAETGEMKAEVEEKFEGEVEEVYESEEDATQKEVKQAKLAARKKEAERKPVRKK